MSPCAVRCAVLWVLALALLSACGANDGQANTERPSVTASLSPTLASLSPTLASPSPTRPSPSPTRGLPSPTRSADVPDQTKSESPRPSRSSTLSPDTTEPAPAAPSTREPEPTTQQPTARTSTVIAVPVPSATSAAPSSSTSPSPAVAEGTTEDEAVPTAVWVALAVLAVAVAVGTWLLVRTRRRRSWLTRLKATRADVEWFAGELVPQLRASGSADRVAGGWQVAAPRVAAAEDQLTVLESSARSQEDAARARQLRDAVRAAREKMEVLSGPGRHDEWALDLDEVAALLVAALGPTSVDGPGAVAPR